MSSFVQETNLLQCNLVLLLIKLIYNFRTILINEQYPTESR